VNGVHRRFYSSCFSIAVITAVAFCPYTVQCQPHTTLRTGKIDVRILNAIHEPEEAAVSYVRVAATIRSADVPFVVPQCSDAENAHGFCMALLCRSNGKVIPVRKGLEATLGFDDESLWKPVELPPNGTVEFQFSVDMGLLSVRPGEEVRIAFWIWPDGESMKDLKRATKVLTPVFRIPVNPD
jgi:hypothetical protein